MTDISKHTPESTEPAAPDPEAAESEEQLKETPASAVPSPDLAIPPQTTTVEEQLADLASGGFVEGVLKSSPQQIANSNVQEFRAKLQESLARLRQDVAHPKQRLDLW
jgi:hypothetical protein